MSNENLGIREGFSATKLDASGAPVKKSKRLWWWIMAILTAIGGYAWWGQPSESTNTMHEAAKVSESLTVNK